MKFTALTKQALEKRRQRRDLLSRGYEEVGEFGGKLWELYRGYRSGHVITDTVIGKDGRSIFVKVSPPPSVASVRE